MANEFFSDQHTQVLQKLVREIVNDPSTYLGSKYLPSIAMPVRRIRTEVIEASGGLTNEHTIGSDPLYVQSFGSRVQEFEPSAYRESIKYDEKKILFLRELGQNDMSKSGIRQYIDIDVDRLNRRLEARIEKLRWDALFTGGFSYLGKSFSFGVPTANLATPLGALWSDTTNSNPITDLRYYLMGGYAPYRKYKITKMIMNPVTARLILDNANVKSFVQSYFSAENYGPFEVEKTLKMAIPGCPQVEIYQGWYQSESLSGSKLVVSDAIYMIPDGKVFFECALPGGDKIGEFVQSINLASGTIESPGTGKFLVIEDNTAPGTRGGPKNPFIDITAGVTGGVKMDRPFDILTGAFT